MLGWKEMDGRSFRARRDEGMDESVEEEEEEEDAAE